MITLAHATIGIQHAANMLKPAILSSRATAKLEVAAQVSSFPYQPYKTNPTLSPATVRPG